MCGPPVVQDQDFLKNHIQCLFFLGVGGENSEGTASLFRLCTSKHQGWEFLHC